MSIKCFCHKCQMNRWYNTGKKKNEPRPVTPIFQQFKNKNPCPCNRCKNVRMKQTERRKQLKLFKNL